DREPRGRGDLAGSSLADSVPAARDLFRQEGARELRRLRATAAVAVHGYRLGRGALRRPVRGVPFDRAVRARDLTVWSAAGTLDCDRRLQSPWEQRRWGTRRAYRFHEARGFGRHRARRVRGA